METYWRPLCHKEAANARPGGAELGDSRAIFLAECAINRAKNSW